MGWVVCLEVNNRKNYKLEKEIPIPLPQALIWLDNLQNRTQNRGLKRVGRGYLSHGSLGVQEAFAEFGSCFAKELLNKHYLWKTGLFRGAQLTS